MKKWKTRFTKTALVTAMAVAWMVPTAASAASAATPNCNDIVTKYFQDNSNMQPYMKIVVVQGPNITVTVPQKKPVITTPSVPVKQPSKVPSVSKPQPQPSKPQVTVPAQPSKPSTPPSNAATTDQAKFAEQVVKLVNQERAKQGLSALAVDTQLANMAMDKAVDMYKNNYFSHQSPTYGSPFDMMNQYNIKYGYAGENIAKGQQSPAQVMQDWMNSQGHRENIMNAHYTHIGVAYYQGEWVQEFISKA
jgi:uncharacterized YkwD family protein